MSLVRSSSLYSSTWPAVSKNGVGGVLGLVIYFNVAIWVLGLVAP